MTDDTRPAYPSAGLGGLNDPMMVDRATKTTSPTGEPKVKPSAVKWWLAGTVGAVAGLELCAQQAPNPTVQLVCRVAAVALGAFIGAASPGFRKK